MLRYIPDSSLYILDDQQKKRPYNDYIVPRWGSVAIVNKERDLMRAESQSQLMVAHLRTLFGVPDLNHHVVNNHVFKFEHGPHGISYFELQLYQHQHILTSIIVSTETLSALIRLVDKQTRLPIPHSLKEVTEETCTLIQQSHLFYKESYLQALEAREKSEAAFLDPRMVGMVYFPDEHLFAIYLPLFLPLLASLAKKLRQEWKITKQEKAILLENKMK
ncbi:GPI transamidase component [Coelomomyces lativittatus]|nr:GPI transamidase component [Coelomomyces lativittatus]